MNCRTWNEVLRLLNFFETRSTMIKNYFLSQQVELTPRDRKSFDVEIFHQTLRLRRNRNSPILAVDERSHPCSKVIKFDARFQNNLNRKKRKPTPAFGEKLLALLLLQAEN